MCLKGCRNSDDISKKNTGFVSVIPSPAVTMMNRSNVVNTVTGGVLSTTRIMSPQTIVKPLINPRVITPSSLPTDIVNGNASFVVHHKIPGTLPTQKVVSTSPKPIAAATPVSPTPIKVNLPTGAVAPNQISGQLITLPPHVTTKLNLQKPLNLKLNGQTFHIPPNCFIATSDGVKVLLPPGSLPDNVAKGGASNPLAISTSKPAGSQQLDVRSMVNGDTASNKDSVVDLTSDSQLPNSQANEQDKNKDKDKSDKRSQRKTVKTGMDKNLCHFRKLHAGFDCMVHIFRLLTVPDLLR